MASILTNRGMYLILSGSVDLTGDTIKVMLLASTFTPLATHNFVSDISASELSGTGYTGGFAGSGRKTLASKTFAEDDTGGVSTFDAANASWTAINAGTTNCAAIIKEVTSNADSPVLGFITYVSTATSGGPLSLDWSVNGIFRITAWDSSNAGVTVVPYTATGFEGTDFSVPVGTSMASDTYEIVWSAQDVVNVPVLSLPDVAAGDRTLTAFRVLTADVLTAGDVLTFLLFE